MVAGLLVAAVVLVPSVAGAATRDQVRRPGPLRVLLVGDSNTVNYENIAAAALNAKGYQVTKNGFGATGLLDADLCKGRWAKEALNIIDPDVVIMEYIGAYGFAAPCNPNVQSESKAFYNQWRGSATTTQHVLTRHKARFYWVAMPPLLLDPYTRFTPQLNAIYRSLGPTIETWNTTAYTQPGGNHLTAQGFQMLSDRVVATVG
jgi:hypothetical protein